MIKLIVAAISFTLLIAAAAKSQEVTIVNFPIGVGGSINPSFFDPYRSQLQSLADTLHKYPMALAVVTGGADGLRYRQNNDAKNPGLAVGRAHALRNLLMNDFKVDSAQLVIQSGDIRDEGSQYRYASVRIAWELVRLDMRLDTLSQRPPVEKNVTQVIRNAQDIKENMGIRLAAGVTSSPFGGIPIISGGVTWNRVVFVEGIVGYTFWRSKIKYISMDLNTRRRIAGGQMVVFPLSGVPLGIVGGWVRVEEISQRFYEYLKMSEGPMFGLQLIPFRYICVTGSYNPSKQIIAGSEVSRLKNRQFLVFATINMVLGGGK